MASNFMTLQPPLSASSHSMPALPSTSSLKNYQASPIEPNSHTTTSPKPHSLDNPVPDPPEVAPEDLLQAPPPPPSSPNPLPTVSLSADIQLNFKSTINISPSILFPPLNTTTKNNMDLSTIVALSVCPAMLGVQEAIRQSQAKNKREEHRARRCNLVVSCVSNSIRAREINGRPIVLKNGKMYVNTATVLSDGFNLGSAHPFTGYYLPYPDSKYEGLVTTIQPDPPMLNWVFIDAATHALRYGVRLDADAKTPKGVSNVTGPFDCTSGDRRLTLLGWEGFAAVEECPGVWALYFDKNDDGLRGKIPSGMRVLEVEVQRRETKVPMPEQPTSRTLDEKMAELKRQNGSVNPSETAHGDEISASTEQLGKETRKAGSKTTPPLEETSAPLAVKVSPQPSDQGVVVDNVCSSMSPLDLSDEDSTGRPDSVFSLAAGTHRRGTSDDGVTREEGVGGDGSRDKKGQTPETSVLGEGDERYEADNEGKRRSRSV